MRRLRGRRLNHQLAMRRRMRCGGLGRHMRRGLASFSARSAVVRFGERVRCMSLRSKRRSAPRLRMGCRVTATVLRRRRMPVPGPYVRLRVPAVCSTSGSMPTPGTSPRRLRCRPLPTTLARMLRASVRLRRVRSHRTLRGSCCRHRHPHCRNQHHHFPHVASGFPSCLSSIGRRLYPTRTCNNPHID
jgi:hypothetical protein